MDKRDRMREAIDAFGARYDYDMSYQRALLDAAPDSFEAFSRAQGLPHVRKYLTADQHYTAAISMMQAEDCGDCLVLNVKMAREAGVPGKLIEALLERPADLSPVLADVRAQAFAVSGSPVGDREVGKRLREALGEPAFAELALLLAGLRLYPSVKRALLVARPAAVALAEHAANA